MPCEPLSHVNCAPMTSEKWSDAERTRRSWMDGLAAHENVYPGTQLVNLLQNSWLPLSVACGRKCRENPTATLRIQLSSKAPLISKTLVTSPWLHIGRIQRLNFAFPTCFLFFLKSHPAHSFCCHYPSSLELRLHRCRPPLLTRSMLLLRSLPLAPGSVWKDADTPKREWAPDFW